MLLLMRSPGLAAALARAARAALLAALAAGRLAGEDAAAAGARDFTRPGPYPVGVRTLVLVDDSRRDDFTESPRTLVTEIWYPAVDASREAPRARFAEFFGPWREEGERALKLPFAVIEPRFRTLAARDAERRALERAPLLIFSHGNGGFRHQNVFQMDHLASHGYIVASPDHTGNAMLAPLPGKAVGRDRGGRQRSADDRPLDVSFLIDWFLRADAKEGGWLRGAIDRERIGVLGHSFGGYTACAAATRDPRIRAIAPMTVALAGFSAAPARVPTMVFLAAHDMTMGALGNITSRGYYSGCPGEKYLLTLRRGGHFTYTEMAVLDPDFGDGIGRGKGLDGAEMDFIPVPLAKEIINAYTLAFFDAALRGKADARGYLGANHYEAEVDYRHEPPRTADAEKTEKTEDAASPGR